MNTRQQKMNLTPLRFLKIKLGLCMFALCIALSSVAAQQVDWLVVDDERSLLKSIDSYANGDYLFSGRDHAQMMSFISRVRQDGTLVWKQFVSGNGMINFTHSALINANNTITVYYSDASYVVLDDLGVNEISSGKLEFDGYDNILRLSVQKVGVEHVVSGFVVNNSSGINFYASLDPITGTVSREMTFNEPVFSFFTNVTSDDKVFVTSISTDEISYTLFDENGEVVWADQMNRGSLIVTDVQILDNDRFYLLGSVEEISSPDMYRGYVGCYSMADGSNIWDTSFPLEGQDTYSRLTHVVATSNDELLVGGEVGQIPRGPITDMQYARLNKDGDILWTRREHINGEADDVTGIYPLDDQCVLFIGNSGLSDVSGFEQTYMMKLDLASSSLLEVDHQLNIGVKMNPVESFLILDGDLTNQALDYEIFDMQGRVLESSSILSESIDVSYLSAGQYYILLQNEEKVSLEKFVKQ